MSAWTTTDLETLEKAIVQGTLRVQYADKLIEYRSLNDMMRLRDIVRKELGLVNPNAGRKFAQHSKGLE